MGSPWGWLGPYGVGGVAMGLAGLPQGWRGCQDEILIGSGWEIGSEAGWQDQWDLDVICTWFGQDLEEKLDEKQDEMINKIWTRSLGDTGSEAGWEAGQQDKWVLDKIWMWSGQDLEEKLDEKQDEKMDYKMNEIWTRSGRDPEQKLDQKQDKKLDNEIDKIWTMRSVQRYLDDEIRTTRSRWRDPDDEIQTRSGNWMRSRTRSWIMRLMRYGRQDPGCQDLDDKIQMIRPCGNHANPVETLWQPCQPSEDPTNPMGIFISFLSFIWSSGMPLNWKCSSSLHPSVCSTPCSYALIHFIW